jgi:hypothetical protein
MEFIASGDPLFILELFFLDWKFNYFYLEIILHLYLEFFASKLLLCCVNSEILELHSSLLVTFGIVDIVEFMLKLELNLYCRFTVGIVELNWGA